MFITKRGKGDFLLVRASTGVSRAQEHGRKELGQNGHQGPQQEREQLSGEQRGQEGGGQHGLCGERSRYYQAFLGFFNTNKEMISSQRGKGVTI